MIVALQQQARQLCIFVLARLKHPPPCTLAFLSALYPAFITCAQPPECLQCCLTITGTFLTWSLRPSCLVCSHTRFGCLVPPLLRMAAGLPATLQTWLPSTINTGMRMDDGHSDVRPSSYCQRGCQQLRLRAMLARPAPSRKPHTRESMCLASHRGMEGNCCIPRLRH